MGMLGPLTSQALGRSPYDDVVLGEGEDDPRTPRQIYDERGRPVNPETRRINRDVIRSHNEVMLVIGVAEPENGIPDAQAEATVKQYEYENNIGRNLFDIHRVVDTANVWGVNGLRQRILLYKQYARVPFHDLFEYHRTRQSAASSLLSGLPSLVAGIAIRQAPIPYSKFPWARSLSTYVQLHLEIFSFLQRVGIASSTAILPNWKFFLPGSSLSPISIPPLPTSFAPGSIIQWIGGCIFGIMPFATYYALSRASHVVTMYACAYALHMLPHPRNAERRGLSHHQPSTTPSRIPSTAEPAARPEEEPRNGRDINRERAEDPNFRVLEGQPQNEALPVGAGRRQSTISVRGDEFASDDEETEVISATLISFDVEATESTDTTPGVWSAELRPNVADSRAAAATAAQDPVYRETFLASLPPILAADALGVALARILMMPWESQALLRLAREFTMRQRLPLDTLHDIGMWQNLSWARLRNAVGMELVFLFMQGEAWAAFMLIAERFRYSEEEWNSRVGLDESEDN
ncbi:hypothetical protein B0H67DRAFT_533983 [Lasiosphaeris hirsuta]|uniref:Uncharacterized protein n=1 Tax=Lasiosphaeris hirsuta TaxID=260670 RepID=A0AA40E273_9PEZI|nr:hypothetical protein B0H67DRAFT_533983 [Lasiosphaeris hirsuta]